MLPHLEIATVRSGCGSHNWLRMRTGRNPFSASGARSRRWATSWRSKESFCRISHLRARWIAPLPACLFPTQPGLHLPACSMRRSRDAIPCSPSAVPRKCLPCDCDSERSEGPIHFICSIVEERPFRAELAVNRGGGFSRRGNSRSRKTLPSLP